jgi:hypothetical protein
MAEQQREDREELVDRERREQEIGGLVDEVRLRRKIAQRVVGPPGE